MNWNDVKSLVVEAAPVLGGLLGGPAGGVAGTLISKALGVPNTPDAIITELKNNPDALVKVKQIEAEKEVELQRLYVAAQANRLAAETQQFQEETKQMESVNQTARAEANSEHPWVFGWRPFIGYITGIAFLVVVIFICFLAYKAIVLKDPTAMTMIPQFITAMTLLFGIPGAILGVASWHRGQKQRIEAAWR